jgi:hypothetical protein
MKPGLLREKNLAKVLLFLYLIIFGFISLVQAPFQELASAIALKEFTFINGQGDPLISDIFVLVQGQKIVQVRSAIKLEILEKAEMIGVPGRFLLSRHIDRLIHITLPLERSS